MTTIEVRFTAEGWHRWPLAAGNRAYLGHRHRHLFHIQAQLDVVHDDRDVEFHNLLDWLKLEWPGNGEWGAHSCESIARIYVDKIRDAFPGRAVTVGVFEDGEVGAWVRHDCT